MLRDVHQRSSIQDADGIAAVYDVTRSKYLSVARPSFVFGYDHKAAIAQTYLRTVDGVPSSQAGYLLPRDATIVAVSIKLSATANASIDIEVDRGGTFVLLTSITLTGEDEKIVTGSDLDALAGDALVARVTAGPADHPVVSVETAWRLTI